MSGVASGITQAAGPSHPDLDPLALWQHPLDLWLTTHSIQHWPAIVVKARVAVAAAAAPR